MATLWATVYEHSNQTALGDPIETHKLTFTGTSAEIAGVIAGSDKKKRTVRIFSDADCHVVWGSGSQTATTDDLPMGAENPEYFSIEAGYKIAAITR